jgi:hypothetical protein
MTPVVFRDEDIEEPNTVHRSSRKYCRVYSSLIVGLFIMIATAVMLFGVIFGIASSKCNREYVEESNINSYNADFESLHLSLNQVC